MAVQEAKTEALAFVTKKVLVTFNQQICVMVNENPVFTHAAVCEYQQSSDENRMHIPDELTIVGLPNGPKLTKSLHARMSPYSSILAMVELD
jgi:hypothetical protein